MSVRRKICTLVAATVTAALALAALAGCSLIPGLGSSGKTAATRSAAATKTPPGVSKLVTSTVVTTNAVTINATKPWTDISEDIDGIKARQVEETGGLLVDLRPRPDFHKRHIEGAINVPMWKFTTVAETWGRDRSIVVYDETGANGQTAQTWLERNGFHRIYHLYRGIEAYDEGLVGSDPKPFPPQEPVVYYFYMSWDPKRPVSDAFIKGLKAEFPGEFELHKVNAWTLDGLIELMEFGGIQSNLVTSSPLAVEAPTPSTLTIPTFRLVDEQGHDEQYTGYDQMVKVRTHLKRAVEKYRAAEY